MEPDDIQPQVTPFTFKLGTAVMVDGVRMVVLDIGTVIGGPLRFFITAEDATGIAAQLEAEADKARTGLFLPGIAGFGIN